MSKIRGLDAIRFVCALWVVLGHYDLPVPHGHQQASLLLKAVSGLAHVSFVGVAAVMVFFVISGFCIRYPFRHGEKVELGEYFCRRYIRIGVPLGVATILVHLAGPSLVGKESAVLWSLYAEIIYYTLYPLLMLAKERIGWRGLLAASFAGAAAMILLGPHTREYNSYGVGLNWVLGLPLWLLGCRLAEEADGLTAARIPTIWLWRVGLWVGSCVCSALRFHGPLGYPITLTAFGVLVFFWMRLEIRHFRYAAPPALLERAGAWSYSLYLMHYPALWLFDKIGLSRLPLPGAALWLLEIGGALVCAYGFFLLVERPSHWLARQFKRKSGDKPEPLLPKPAAPEPASDAIALDRNRSVSDGGI